jgi:hypothetical protein
LIGIVVRKHRRLCGLRPLRNVERNAVTPVCGKPGALSLPATLARVEGDTTAAVVAPASMMSTAKLTRSA